MTESRRVRRTTRTSTSEQKREPASRRWDECFLDKLLLHDLSNFSFNGCTHARTRRGPRLSRLGLVPSLVSSSLPPARVWLVECRQSDDTDSTNMQDQECDSDHSGLLRQLDYMGSE